jgi:hypothetical protein
VGTVQNTAEVRADGRRVDADTESTLVVARADGGGGGGGGDADTLNCDDFSSRGEAQRELERDRSDPHNLDPDNDGQACEDFDYNDNTQNNDTTTNDTTTNDTTTGETTTANDALETTTADDANALNSDLNSPDSDNFRCDFFLRVVRDEQGALRDQYEDNELIVQRFEQCLSEDVLADTIPDRELPFTGGPMLFLAAIGLASLFAGASVLGAATRRRR